MNAEPRRSLLEALDPGPRGRLLARAVTRRLARGDVLMLAGDSAERVYVLTAGVVKLVARDIEGRQTIVGLAVEGDIIGDVAVLHDAPQDLDAIAAADCTALGIDAQELVRALESSPGAALELAKSIASRLRWAGAVAFECAGAEVPARLAGRLLDLGGILGRRRDGVVEMELPVAQEDLARMAGMCRESACKALRKFKAQGLVEYRGRRLRILRPDALEHVRCTGRVGGFEPVPHSRYGTLDVKTVGRRTQEESPRIG